MLAVTLSQGRPGPRRPAAGLERGARPAAAVGPAVVAAHPAGAGLRVRPARVRRPLRRAPPSSSAKVAELVDGARAEIDRVQEMGGAVAAVESRLPEDGPRRLARAAPPAASSRATRSSSGVNRFETYRAQPADRRPRHGDPDRRRRRRGRRGGRGAALARRARRRPERRERRGIRAGPPARGGRHRRNLMAATLECARAGVTTGEWAGVLREVFGEYRAPTGCQRLGRRGAPGPRRCAACARPVRADRRRARRAAAAARRQARPRRALQRRRADRGPGPRRRLRGRLPGHPAHARSRSSRRPWPRTCTASASRSCPARTWSWCPRCSSGLREAGAGDVPVVVGGIIPEADAAALRDAGRRRGLHAQGLRDHRHHGAVRRGHPGARGLPALSPPPPDPSVKATRGRDLTEAKLSGIQSTA